MKRRRIGGLLRRYRTEAGMASKDAARAANLDATRLGRIEQGRYRITPAQITALMEVYGIADDVAREELCRAAEESPGVGWWVPHKGHLATAYTDYIALESEAETLRVQHSVVVHGLLQCPAYARGMLESSIHPPTREKADVLYAVRMTRQQIITRPRNPVKIHAVVPDVAFHARFDTGSSVIRDQLQHLLILAEQDNVTIQVLPLASPPNFGMYQATDLLTFRHPWPAVVNYDTWRGASLSDEPEEIEAVEEHFDQLAKVALPAKESRDLLEDRLKKG